VGAASGPEAIVVVDVDEDGALGGVEDLVAQLGALLLAEVHLLQVDRKVRVVPHVTPVLRHPQLHRLALQRKEGQHAI
jgi:hypothetical protein